MNKAQIEEEHRKKTDWVIEQLGHDDTTFGDELAKLGKRVLGSKFKGVFPSDKIPSLPHKGSAIVNLDKTGEPGSHWVGLYREGNRAYMYDSFGRSIKKILPSLYGSGNGNPTSTEIDIEQKKHENKCGQLSLGALMVLDKYGKRAASFL